MLNISSSPRIPIGVGNPTPGVQRSFLGLFAANALAQAAALAAYPVLTRLYSPQQLGILSVLMSGMMLLTPAATLRYEVALPLCRSAKEAAAVLVLCFTVVGVITLGLALALLAMPTSLLSMLGAAAPYRLFLPLALLAFGAYNVLVYEATRLGEYAPIARTRISQAVTGPVVQIALGAAGLGTLGLLIGFVVGLFSGTLRLARRFVIDKALLAGTSMRNVLHAAVEHRHFALFSSWAGVLANSTNLGNLLFATVYGTTVGGFVFLADRVLMQPLRVSGNAFLQVYVGEAGRVLKSDPVELMGLFVSVLWKQTALAAAWLGLLYLLAQTAMPLVFGANWGPAAPYLRAMLIGYLVSAAALPTSHTLLLLGKQKLGAMLDALRVAALVGSIVISLHGGARPLAAVFSFYLTQAAAQCLILVILAVQVRGVSRRAAPASLPR